MRIAVKVCLQRPQGIRESQVSNHCGVGAGFVWSSAHNFGPSMEMIQDTGEDGPIGTVADRNEMGIRDDGSGTYLPVFKSHIGYREEEKSIKPIHSSTTKPITRESPPSPPVLGG